MSVGQHILYLSYDGMTDPLGQSQVLPYLKELSRHGYEFTLISFEKEKAFNKGKADIEKIIEDTVIRWIPLPYHKSPPVISTLYDVFVLKRKIKKLHKEKPFHIVHTRGYITALAGLWMKKKWNVRFLFDMRGFFADERVDGKVWNLKNPIFRFVYNYFKNKEKQFFLEANHAISLTHEGEKTIRSFPYINKSFKCSVIPCCADLHHFSVLNINTQIANDFALLHRLNTYTSRWFYIGSIGTWYMLSEMLDFFKIVLHHDATSLLAFFTHDNPEQIFHMAKAKGIQENAIIVMPLARKDIPSVISLFDASVFFIRPVFSKKASSPTKQGEIMAMGIPIVCNDDVGDTGHIIHTYHAGIAISAFNNEEYEKAYNFIKNKQYNRNEILRGAKEWFSLSQGIDAYHKTYREMLSTEN